MSNPTHYEYEISKRISAEDYQFYALLCALFRQADDCNLAKLEAVFPEEMEMFRERYYNPGGMSDSELERLRDGEETVEV